MPNKETKRSEVEQSTPDSQNAESYNKRKDFNGQQYTGVQIGRGHTWHYDSGVWKERKVTPDKWELTYNVKKRRAGHAPKGSGAAVGTGYHWFILSHQFVEKQNADDYTTSMIGMKFKLAHKRAGNEKWSSSDNAQRNRLIQILKDLISDLEKQPEIMKTVPLEFTYRGKDFKGEGIPLLSGCHDGVCFQLDIILNDDHLGIIRCTPKGWKITGITQGLVNAIGNEIFKWYE